MSWLAWIKYRNRVSDNSKPPIPSPNVLKPVIPNNPDTLNHLCVRPTYISHQLDIIIVLVHIQVTQEHWTSSISMQIRKTTTITTKKHFYCYDLVESLQWIMLFKGAVYLIQVITVEIRCGMVRSPMIGVLMLKLSMRWTRKSWKMKEWWARCWRLLMVSICAWNFKVI